MFISFEGIDGSGKTTCLMKLKQYLKDHGLLNNFVFTREPGGFNLKECEEIRKIILDKNNIIDDTSEMLLYLASRKIHVERLIIPSIKKNKIVLCDRFYDSSIAYQGNGRKLGMDWVEKINLDILNNLKPNLTFYFKIDYKTTIKRLKKNNRELDRLEEERESFFKKVIEGYEILAQKNQDRFIIIDATKNLEDVFLQVLKYFKKFSLI